MRNIIVFGNVPLATWLIKQLLSNKSFNLLGVVCDDYSADYFSHHGMEEESVYSYCVRNSLTILNFDEALELAKSKSILGLSVRYHKLFKPEYYECFTPGIVNLHGGELPRYRGANIANYAVYEDAKQVGGTLHFIAEGIDEGDIVERVIIPVTGKLTAYEFFKLTLVALKQAFSQFIAREDILSNIIAAKPQKEYEDLGELNKLYYKREIELKRQIEFSDIKNWDQLYRLARAYTFPGHKGLVVKSGDEYIEIKAYKDDK